MRPGGIAHYCAPYLGALCLLNPPLGRAAETSAAQALHPERWPRLKPALPRDPDLESRIEALVARMTSAQKVGQLIQADIDSITPDDLAHDPLGSVLNGGNSSPMAISSLHRVSGSRWPTGSMTFRSGQGAPPGSPSCGVPTRCTATTTSPAPRSSRTTSAPARRATPRSSAASTKSPLSRFGSPDSIGRFPPARRWPGRRRRHRGAVPRTWRGGALRLLGQAPFSWPRSARVPAVDGGPGEPPLFPYGYGLTYEDDGELPQLPEGEAGGPGRA